MKKIKNLNILMALTSLFLSINTSCVNENNRDVNYENKLGEVVEQIRYVEIPRTHEGVTLGQSMVR